MEKENLRWFRLAKYFFTVGTEVLINLLKLKIQTCCFSEYHELWFEKLSFHGRSDDLKILFDAFDQECRALDASSQQILQPLLAKWKCSCLQTPMEIRQQLSVLKSLESDIHICISNHTSQQDTFKKWSSEIQSLGDLHTSLLTLIKSWTQDYTNICQVDQLNLMRITQWHHERTNNLLTAFLKKLECCTTQSPGEFHTLLTTFQQEEVNSDRELQALLDAFFIAWKPKIDILLDQWFLLIPTSPHQHILHNILTDVRQCLPGKHQTCQIGLQNMYHTWYSNLRKMMSEWGNKLQQVGTSTTDLQDLGKTCHKELQTFPYPFDEHIREFFVSKRNDLQRLKSRRIITSPQWSLLYPAHGYTNLQNFDITLLSTLHINVFPICPPEMSGQILETDNSTWADLMRLKKLRNDYIGHVNDPTLTTDEFENLWTTLDAILHRLSKSLDDQVKDIIDQKGVQLKTCPFDLSEEMQFKLELITCNQGDMLHLEQSTDEKLEKCLNHVQTIDEKFQILQQHEAFKTERVEHIEKSVNNVEQSISTTMEKVLTFLTRLETSNTELQKRLEAANDKQQTEIHCQQEELKRQPEEIHNVKEVLERAIEERDRQKQIMLEDAKTDEQRQQVEDKCQLEEEERRKIAAEKKKHEVPGKEECQSPISQASTLLDMAHPQSNTDSSEARVQNSSFAYVCDIPQSRLPGEESFQTSENDNISQGYESDGSTGFTYLPQLKNDDSSQGSESDGSTGFTYLPQCNLDTGSVDSSSSIETYTNSVQSGSNGVLSAFSSREDTLAIPAPVAYDWFPRLNNVLQSLLTFINGGDRSAKSKGQSVQDLPSAEEEHIDQCDTCMDEYKTRKRKYCKDGQQLLCEESEEPPRKIQRNAPQDKDLYQPSKTECKDIFGAIHFISYQDSKNPDVESKGIRWSDSGNKYDSSNGPSSFRTVDRQSSRMNDLLSVLGRVRSPEYANLKDRLETFSRWPSDIVQTPEQAAEAGFYYTGFQDIVRCFVCDGGLKNWDPEDDPWIEHARWFPQCAYVRHVKGKEFINLVRMVSEDLDEEDDYIVHGGATWGGAKQNNTNADSALHEIKESSVLESEDAQAVIEMGFSRRVVAMAINDIFKTGKKDFTCQEIADIILEKETRGETSPTKLAANGPPSAGNQHAAEQTTSENKHLRELFQCTECKTRQRNILFLPCTHHVACELCSRDLHICTCCFREIKEKIRTYMS